MEELTAVIILALSFYNANKSIKVRDKQDKIIHLLWSILLVIVFVI